MTVDLTKTQERAVHFAWFCKEYNVPPYSLAEVINLENLRTAKRYSNLSYDKRREVENEIVQRLVALGFADVNFYTRHDGKVYFKSYKHTDEGEALTLPIL